MKANKYWEKILESQTFDDHGGELEAIPDEGTTVDKLLR